MIGQITGLLAAKNDRFVVIETASGLGYKVFVTAPTLKTLRKNSKIPLCLWTHLAVREDSLDLYGFREPKELQFFEWLITVPGIGPKSALAVLSLAPPVTLERAIRANDSGYLTKISGIGRKNAERIVDHLQEKIGSLNIAEDSAALAEEAEVIEALRALGYDLDEAREAIRQIPKESSGSAAKIKAALRLLGR